MAPSEMSSILHHVNVKAVTWINVSWNMFTAFNCVSFCHVVEDSAGQFPSITVLFFLSSKLWDSEWSITQVVPQNFSRVWLRAGNSRNWSTAIFLVVVLCKTLVFQQNLSTMQGLISNLHFFLLSSQKSVETECQNWLTDWRIRSTVMFTPEQFLCRVPSILDTGAQCPADNKLLKCLGYKTRNEAAHLINKTAAKWGHKPITVADYWVFNGPYPLWWWSFSFPHQKKNESW